MDGARNADLSRGGQLLQTRGDVHPVPVDIAFLDDHIADVDADAESDALLLGQLPLALGHAPLDRRGALDRIYNASELDQHAIAHELDDATVVLGDLRLDEIFAEGLQARVGPRLVARHEPAVADNVGGQNRRELPIRSGSHGGALCAIDGNQDRTPFRAEVDEIRVFGGRGPLDTYPAEPLGLTLAELVRSPAFPGIFLPDAPCNGRYGMGKGASICVQFNSPRSA